MVKFVFPVVSENLLSPFLPLALGLSAVVVDGLGLASEEGLGLLGLGLREAWKLAESILVDPSSLHQVL